MSSDFRQGMIVGALIVLIAALGFVGYGKAQDWIVGSGIAFHLDGGHHCHDHFTAGIGYERGISRDLKLSAGFYDNSNCAVSTYAAAAWTPLHHDPLHLGLLAGVVTGYRNAVIPAGGLIASYERRRWGANLIYIPPLHGSGNVAWLQFKVPW